MNILDAFKSTVRSVKDYVNKTIPTQLAVDEDNMLYLLNESGVISNGVQLPQGGGGGGGSGGGGSNNAILTVKSTTDWTYKVISDNTTCVITGNWSSLENELETGNGTLMLYVNNAIKMTKNIPQGDFVIDVTQYLSFGSNTVKVKIIDIYENSRIIAFNINRINLNITSTFDATVPYDSEINYSYTPTGDAIKIVHFILDGVEIGTAEVAFSGRQQTYTINKQSHGSHMFEVYFTADIEGETVQSNHLYYDLIFITTGETTPIISCAYNNNNISQFETITIPYIVYSPVSLTSEITLLLNGEKISELIVDRTQQIWAFRADSYGVQRLTISCGEVFKNIELNVAESTIDVEAATDGLELFLSSYGRSNNEINPAVWSYNNISCTFENYNWTSDGWISDDDGITVHRVTGDARLIIPLRMFANDFRTTGKTIEFEFATRDVRNYDTEVISCYSGNIGFKLTAQKATLKSEQSEISTQYKENEHIRLAFVVEKRIENRLIYIYLNGIMCGAVQYPTDDDFTQAAPVDISIGSNDCTIDLYNIRVYNNDLTRYQILDNWIADTQNISLKVDRYAKNNIFDAYGNIVIEKLPADLPYLVLDAETLPQYKGNKITVDGEYVNQIDTKKSFTFTGAQCDVQGTSSAGYARKNYKLKLKNGLTQNGETKDSYSLRDDSLSSNVFCFKADVASSEGANNVELVRLYNDACPYKTPYQLENPSIRQGIDGFPIVIFQNDGTNTTFIGKYNFNWDKSSDVFGFTTGDESWETLNNTSDRVLYKSADFAGDGWKNDFEARYPKDNEDITNLASFASWVASTDRNAVTGGALASPVIYDGVEYTADTAEYRLAKFRAEINDHAELDSALFYYLFTELFLMVDSRAKNAFPSLIGGDKICWLPYDFDTAVGIDNEGALKFGYELEDIDTTESGADIYNGQQSVFWCNIRDAFKTELKTMYQQLRSTNELSYDVIETAYENHQAVWPAAIWNEDAFFKYLQPLLETGAGIYLPMLQGSKSEQRKWWLYNRFRYIDSKYNAGDALKDFITLRGYAKSDITITPYADIYASVKYGSYLMQKRALRGNSYTLTCPLDNVNDTEIYIYSASQLKDVGDLSGLKVGLADFSMATKLQSLKVGDADPSYDNGNLVFLTLGNNVLLKTLDARNCSGLGTGEQQAVDLSGCANIEEVYLDGTSIKSVNLPNGGVLKTLHLPDTITNLTIRNQTSLTDFVLNDSTNITTLRLENVGALIDTPSVINAMDDGGRIRLTDVDWTVSSENELVVLFDKLIKMRGLDENGNNTDLAVVSGRCRVFEKVSDVVLGDIYDNFPDLVVDDGSKEIYIINYKDWDGTILYSTRLAEGENAIDPITAGFISTPIRAETQDYKYEFKGWSNLPTNVNKHYVVTAQYYTQYAIKFYVDDTIIYTQYVNAGEAAIDPVKSGVIDAPTKAGTDDLHYVFSEWDNLPTNVQSATSVYAQFANVYPVRFFSDSDMATLVYTQWVIEGNDAIDPVANGDIEAPIKAGTEDKHYGFSKWNSIPTNVTTIIEVYAEYTPIWAVRFYNEDVVLNIQWVQDGDSAVNPISAGYIETPTKDSTAQYNYTFLGWEGDYTNITCSKTIMATYVATIRRYTVYFYNEGELLQTVENVQYGSSATYTGATPVKIGVDNPEEYEFKRFNPEPINITGETKCYALFKFTGYLKDSWATIAANGANGTAADIYEIGGRKEIPITLSDGTMTTADVELIAFNHDDLADGSGKAALTFFCKDLPNILRSMNSLSSVSDGWENSDIRTFINGELFDAFPDELKSVIKPVYKISDGGANNKTLVTTIDNCWLASYNEVGFNPNNNSLSGQGTIYSSIFSSDKESRKKYIVDDTETGGWWLRSTYYTTSSNTMFYRVQKSGSSYGDIQTGLFYVAFGFCI